MTEQDYKDLNYYLNICCKRLRGMDNFFLNNINNFIGLSLKLKSMIDKYDLKEEVEQVNLTYEEVFLLAREIIATINQDYLEEYDDLIKSGRLDFSYDADYFESHFMYQRDNQQWEININRTFDLYEVSVLVHEFMHHKNTSLEKGSVIQYLLTEFISIYFEIYTKNYLINEKGFKKNEVDFNKRMLSTLRQSKAVASYGIPILAFETFGNITDDSANLLNKYNVFKINNEDFQNLCKILLTNFRKAEKRYRDMFKNDNYFNEINLEIKLSEIFSSNYRYLIGTLFAYYAIKNCDVKDIVYLNDHINDEEFNELGIIGILDKIGIDMNNPSINIELINSIEEVLKKGDVCKK